MSSPGVKPTLFIASDVGPPVLYCPCYKCPSLGVWMGVGVPYRWVKGSLISLYDLEQSFSHKLAFKVELGPRSISSSDDDLIDNDLNDYKNDGNHPINMEDDSMHMEDFSSNSQDDAEDCGTESQPGHSFTDGTNFYYGQTFANKKELKMLLDATVTMQFFDYYMEKSCTKLIKAKYLSHGCGWLYRAKKYDTLQKNLSW
ncbi:MDIS1-interacting receptor like kinase 2-like [Capsicum galapagoense]